MGNLPKTHSVGNVTSELNRCEAANGTMSSHQSLELIAALYDLTDGDLKLGASFKVFLETNFANPTQWKQYAGSYLEMQICGDDREKQYTVSRFLCSHNPR